LSTTLKKLPILVPHHGNPNAIAVVISLSSAMIDELGAARGVWEKSSEVAGSSRGHPQPCTAPQIRIRSWLSLLPAPPFPLILRLLLLLAMEAFATTV
jgi:hypothetical protein